MERTIIGFHTDEHGDWVAELSCVHNQHIRHQPPFRLRPWVLTESGRAEHLGTAIDCPLCDRAELPEGLTPVRRLGPFDRDGLPAGLRRVHRLGTGTWGLLAIRKGEIALALPDNGPEMTLSAGQVQAIPPEVPHRLNPRGPVELTIDLLARSRDPMPGPGAVPDRK
jgi:tellurite resistance-related uncharacterized protein